jgi:hypothetical protein
MKDRATVAIGPALAVAVLASIAYALSGRLFG